MIAFKVTYKDSSANVAKAIDKAAAKSFPHAAAIIRKTIIDGVQVTKETIGWITTKRISKRGKRVRARIYRPSPPGTPVHSHRNKGFIRRGVRFEADKQGAVIGFVHSVYGDVMGTHEFGGYRKGGRFDRRPTVRPGLDKNINRITQSFRGSITQSF